MIASSWVFNSLIMHEKKSFRICSVWCWSTDVPRSLCPLVLSVAVVLSPLLPDQLWLSHLGKSSWDKIAPQQMWWMFPHLGSSSWLTALMRGGINECQGKRGRRCCISGGTIPWCQFSRRCWSGAALLLLLFHPWIWGSAPSLHRFLVFRWTCVQCSWGTDLAANRAQSRKYTKWIIKARATSYRQFSVTPVSAKIIIVIWS